MNQEKITFQNSKGDKLVGLLINPTGELDKPIMLLVHGLSSNKNTKRYFGLIDILSKQGISSFRIDLYGHGESEGKFEDCTISEACDDILQAIAYLKKLGYKKIGLVGSSYGGIASIRAASKTNDISILILKSPVCNFPDVFLRSKGKDFIDKWKTEGAWEYDKSRGLTLKYSFYEDSLKNDGYKVAPFIKIPTLIVHGDKDEAVPEEQSIKIAKLIPNCKLHIVAGADHRYTTETHAAEMLKVMSEFINNNL